VSRLAAETRRASKWQALSTRDAVVEALVVTYLAAMAAARAEDRRLDCLPRHLQAGVPGAHSSTCPRLQREARLAPAARKSRALQALSTLFTSAFRMN